MPPTDAAQEDPCLAFARGLYERDVNAEIRGGDDDAYAFHVDGSGVLHVRSGSVRGVLYAVYDALAGRRRSGAERPAFSIRGLNLCESLNRHTPEQVARLIDRMGHWRMNTLVIHSNYGYLSHKQLIEDETARRGIEIIHYTYYNLCFLDGIAPEHFAKDEQGRPLWDRAECETRLCVSDAAGLRQYASNIRRYLEAHPDYQRLLFATADGYSLCQCPGCRDKNAIDQWQRVFDPFFDAAYGQRKLEMLAYIQRFSVPSDLARVRRLERVLFDTHLRYPRTPLGTPHACLRQRLRAGDGADLLQDPRGDRPINVYLWDRLVEWRHAFPGQLYVFENLMIQGICGCPRPNTSIYLQDLRHFSELGIDGVVYEAFEPGIGPFLPTFNAIAAGLWNVNLPYTPTDFETAYLDAEDEDASAHLVGHPKWDGHRGDYPREALAKLMYRFHVLFGNKVPLAKKSDGHDEQGITWCREILNHIIHHPRREDHDWIYMAAIALKMAHRIGALMPADARERDFLQTRKTWDFQERHVPPRQATVEVILSLYDRFAPSPGEHRG